MGCPCCFNICENTHQIIIVSSFRFENEIVLFFAADGRCDSGLKLPQVLLMVVLTVRVCVAVEQYATRRWTKQNGQAPVLFLVGETHPIGPGDRPAPTHFCSNTMWRLNVVGTSPVVVAYVQGVIPCACSLCYDTCMTFLCSWCELAIRRDAKE